MRRESNDAAFRALFREACRRGLGYPLTAPLSETDSKVLAAVVFEQTGLVVGAKTLKNYSFYVLDSADSKPENPSVATLDTLARFVLQAPHTDEARRKDHESHHPYWFQYRRRLTPPQAAGRWSKATWWRLLIGLTGLVLLAGVLWQGTRRRPPAAPANFTDSFTTTAPDSLSARGWQVQHANPTWWNKRAVRPGRLTLYTLPGDNWPAATHAAGIRNLLVRRVTADCFSAEIHFTDFFPAHNWQQAGILLAENEYFTGKMIRLSLSYNDYFGGYTYPSEILIQGISSAETADGSKPEEFAHVPLFVLRYPGDSIVAANLRNSALKIEKKGQQLRFLYAAGAMESFAFKEAASGSFAIVPRYIGVFAIQGFAPAAHVAPVHVDSFSLFTLPCEQ